MARRTKGDAPAESSRARTMRLQRDVPLGARVIYLDEGAMRLAEVVGHERGRVVVQPVEPSRAALRRAGIAASWQKRWGPTFRRKARVSPEKVVRILEAPA